MEKFFIESIKDVITFISSVPIYSFIKKHENEIEFPELKISDKEFDEKFDAGTIYYDSKKNNIEYHEERIIIHFDFCLIGNPINLIYLAYPLIEQYRRQKKQLTCHAASISLDDKGILILGKEGSGKTSIALNLCIQMPWILLNYLK